MVLCTEEEARDFVAARCTGDALTRLDRFARLLVDEAHAQNLVSRGTLDAIWLRHIADSAQLLDHVSREAGVWLDLGSGAGFPGLVAAIIRPEQRLILVESRNLRIRWLNSVVSTLGLANCMVLGQDIRKVGTFAAGVISARAFAPMDRLIALSARFSTTTTRWVLPKGRSASQEVAMLPRRLQSMFHVKQSVTDPEAGIVLGTGRVEPSA